MLKFCTSLFFLICITQPDLAQALNPKKLDHYQRLIENLDDKKNCQSLKRLANDSNFILKTLASLRFNQNCNPKINWQKFLSQLVDPIYKKEVLQTWFDNEIDNKHYSKAYELYTSYRDFISIDNREFDLMAIGALKASKTTAKKKRQIRKQLERLSPRYIRHPPKSSYLKVAKDFRKDRMFEKALFYYKKVINDPKRTIHQRWNAFRGARITYKLERWSRMKKYILASKQWSRFLKNKYKWSKEMTRLHHDANIAYVRTLWTEKGQNSARKALGLLEKEIKGRYSFQQIYWLKGRMAEEKKQYKKAVSLLSLSAQQKKISERDLERVLWALAWNQRRIGQFDESQKTLNRLLKSPELTHFGKSKYLYWQASNFSDLGQTQQAKKAFENLAGFDLYGFYGALAHRWLNKPFPKAEKNQITLSDQMTLIPKKYRQLFKALIEVEEHQVAEQIVVNKVRTQKNWNGHQWATYLSLLQTAGAYKTFFKKYHRLKPKHQLLISKQYPDLLFPQPYKTHVEEASKLTQVSPALIFSIMKQESGFDVKARSHADAFGLLQLIPQVARRTARRFPQIKYKKPRDLFKPKVIIPLGAANLNQLFKKFKGSFILSVASYNASEQAVKGWVKSRFHGDPISFIEDIPYEETKGYIKLVMRNYIAYNRLETSDDEAFSFPESCLEGLQLSKK